ncbi:MAG: hypothetical protein SGARI_004204 [Bacillariaceae sp.]
MIKSNSNSIQSIVDAFCSGILNVKIYEGRDLRNPEGISKIDPYLRVAWRENVYIGTIHRKTGPHCNFDEIVKFPYDRAVMQAALAGDDEGGLIPPLEIQVMDWNRGRPNTTIGTAAIDFDDMAEGMRSETVTLKYKKGMMRKAEREGGTLIKHWGGGLLMKIVDGGKLEELRTWQINLWCVNDIFRGKTCGWNRHYHAAQQIYGSGPSCAAVRKGIQAQHLMLYSHEKQYGRRECEVQHVVGWKDFLAAIPDHDAGTSEGHGIRFTYVIGVDSVMSFSITSAMTGRDFLSKHALHANAAEEVVYSGEFFVDCSGDPDQRLVIDNNSGTFAPPKDRLPDLKRVLEFNFGKKIPILVLDRGDSELKDLCEANKVD